MVDRTYIKVINLIPLTARGEVHDVVGATV